MINREFTRREKIMLLVLAVLLLGLGYFKFFWTPMQNDLKIQQQRLADVQDSLMIEQTKLLQMQQMEKKMEELKASGAVPDAEVPVYDNVKNVMVQLNAILTRAQEYNLSFHEIGTDDNGIITRPVELSFTAADYATARGIINDLYHCPYRCGVSDITVSTENDLTSGSDIQVSLTITFYEKQSS